MLRNFFHALEIFDWITPTKAILDNATNGESWTFYIPYDKAVEKGWSADFIDGMLAQYGIKQWGNLVHLGEYFFRVPLHQAAWAEHVLNQHDIPLAPKAQGAPHVAKKTAGARETKRYEPKIRLVPKLRSLKRQGRRS